MTTNGSRGREGFVEDKAAPPPVAPQALPQADAAEQGKKRGPAPPTIEPSPAELPPLDTEMWPIKVKLLYKPIRGVTGGEIKEVEIREPKAGDINRYGNPIRVNQDGDVVIDERKMTFMMAALTGILPPFIEDMDPRDWNSVAYRLRRFFLPDPAAW